MKSNQGRCALFKSFNWAMLNNMFVWHCRLRGSQGWSVDRHFFFTKNKWKFPLQIHSKCKFCMQKSPMEDSDNTVFLRIACSNTRIFRHCGDLRCLFWGSSFVISNPRWSNKKLGIMKIYLGSRGPYNYQKALYTGKHFYLPKSTEKTHARRGLYALWITILCVLDNKDVYMWQEKVYDPKM